MDATLSKRNETQDKNRIKENGVHYTPARLARFLSTQTVSAFERGNNKASAQAKLKILDPACGDGELLACLVQSLWDVYPSLTVEATGFDTDSSAVVKTRARLEKMRPNKSARKNRLKFDIFDNDFLESKPPNEKFDLVIANPPYVRTQILGGQESQRLVKKFELSGRVDLYHAFAAAISNFVRPGGAIGLLTSNRFLSVKSGAAMRSLLGSEFQLHHIFDLGDTRLFEAAVLPAIVVGTSRLEQENEKATPIQFHRIYRAPTETLNKANASQAKEHHSETLINAIEAFGTKGEIETEQGAFLIERGELHSVDANVWTLANSRTRKWLDTLRANQSTTFGELAEIKVGIKTTADSVFIRKDWNQLKKSKPETGLLKPLITHHDAQRWAINIPIKQVLYPYSRKKKREPVELKKFPKSAAYLESHRERLEGRKYVIDSGRRWYEIWVPHQPADWSNPKIVWPDISETPKFFFDSSGAIVNGDCYWLKLREDVDPDWFYLMLAVANSEIATMFYDTVFHNKLYAGRRRFMTQYVREFPLPNLESKTGKKIVAATKKIVASPTDKLEANVERLVRTAFGFSS